jgi:alpha-mannosidase
MRVRLVRRSEDDATVTFAAAVVVAQPHLTARYPTRTGALLRIDGRSVAAFDGKHAAAELAVEPGQRELELIVERRSLPIANLPAGDGLRWRLMNARAAARPHATIDLVPASTGAPAPAEGDLAAVGHAHLDVAWLWTYAETRRKARRTFATALRQIEAGSYVFAQSQPQLYAWVAADDPELFARVRARVGDGWDASVATMWVEPDLHLPSGESILRQFAYGMRYAREELGAEPSVVWLPDTFGFPNTLPQLAGHAGARSFATTKLQWNDTTRWPHPQFWWEADDGTLLASAVIDRYESDAEPERARIARERHEPLVVGFGDGGGGATDAAIGRVAPEAWTPLDRWFAALPSNLPRYRGELYLETHRGTYTTHRDTKARNAALERALDEAEELAAWCVAVRVAPSVLAPLRDDLRSAWTIVLRNQFHDVAAGTSIPAVYADVHAEYDRADRIAARVAEGARSILPRSDFRPAPAPAIAPVASGEGFRFENGIVRARVRPDGTLDELAGGDGVNVAALLNGLAAYVDRPKAWDAWNLDRSYPARRVPVKPGPASVEDDALVVRYRIGKRSAATLALSLRADEPYLRAELAVAWREDHVVLRLEHRLAVSARSVRFGVPHGTIERTAYAETDAERARYEVPAQRWALVDDGARGAALFAPNTYGWSAHGLPDGGVRLGMSLLRAPCWPDPGADRGEHRIAYAFVPTAGAPVSALESAWNEYAALDRVRLFSCADPAVLIVATKPADDGDGVIVRVRECDGEPRAVALVCAARMREALPVDGCERRITGAATIVEEALQFPLPAYGLRTFRIRF